MKGKEKKEKRIVLVKRSKNDWTERLLKRCLPV